MSHSHQLLFQEGLNYGTFMLSSFHDLSLGVILMILWFVGGATYLVLSNSFVSSGQLDRSIEIVWTIVPMFILVIMIVPSLNILYHMGTHYREVSNVIVKVTGHQWYWNYSFMDKDFDSYMVGKSGLSKGSFRLLDVDNHLVLPKSYVWALISSEDVIHSWAVPALGVKVDAIPGRLNSAYFHGGCHSSVSYGQCSEICGANHSFMPIVVEVIGLNSFKSWINSFVLSDV